jgi:hypothetical protein
MLRQRGQYEVECSLGLSSHHGERQCPCLVRAEAQSGYSGVSVGACFRYSRNACAITESFLPRG